MSGGVFVSAVRSFSERQKESCKLLTAVKQIELDEVAEKASGGLKEKQSRTLCVLSYGDELSGHKGPRGSLEGYDSAETSFSVDDLAFSGRSLFYLPPGASRDALLRHVAEHTLQISKEDVVDYDAYSMEIVVVQVFLCICLTDIPLAAIFSNSVGAPGTEQCTRCYNVHSKTRSEREERAMRSTASFDVKDIQYSRVQAQTATIMSAQKTSTQLSAKALKDAPLLNNKTDRSNSLMRLFYAYGPGTFVIHENVIVAPFHLLYYNIGSHVQV